MKTKNKIIISLGMLFISLLSIFLVTYAWIINRINTPSIDGNTTGVKFVYELKDYQKNSYKITNVAFINIKRAEEKDYFIDMITCIEIVIENTGDIDCEFSISQVDEHDDTCYIQCLFTSDKVEAIDDLDEFINNNKILQNQEIKINETKTIFMYVFGVQLDESVNNEFLNQEYKFSIEITGEGK